MVLAEADFEEFGGGFDLGAPVRVRVTVHGDPQLSGVGHSVGAAPAVDEFLEGFARKVAGPAMVVGVGTGVVGPTDAVPAFTPPGITLGCAQSRHAARLPGRPR